ncbi:MAG: class I SAM-dependent RNA methyltransferase [Phycisphaerales bacterium]
MIDLTKRSTARIACAPFTVPVLRAELDAFGFAIQGEHPTGVEIGASIEECMSLALRLRSATHVMWQLTRFRCPSPKALYREVGSFPWEQVIAVDGYFSIRAAADTPTIDNEMYPALVTKDAIADRFVKKFGRRPDAGAERSGVCLNLYWKGDRAAVFLNINGNPLSHRGYRKLPHQAPMRETLAASAVLASGYDGTTPFVNPMCGSGTLAIEAALIATNRAPGLLRSDYAVLKTELDFDDAWKKARVDAKAVSKSGDVPLIVATDRDPVAIEAAEKNARVAGVEQLIQFDVCEFIDTEMPEDPGHILLNPEYGERLGITDELIDTYGDIGDFFKQHCKGWTGHVFTGSSELAKKIGLRASRKQPFMNGPIECRLLSFEIFDGARADRWTNHQSE